MYHDEAWLVYGQDKYSYCAFVINNKKCSGVVDTDVDRFCGEHRKLFWTCDGCGEDYEWAGTEKYFVSKDYNSFEGTISQRMCESECKDSWYMG